MRCFLKILLGFFAVIGVLVILLVASAITLVATHKKPALPQAMMLSLDFTREIREKTDGGPLDLALGKGGDLSLAEMIAAMDLAAKDDRVKIVLGDFRGEVASLAGAQELRDAVHRLRDAGKITYAFSTSFGELGPGDHAYYVASAFQNLWLQPLGLLGLTGNVAQMPFLKGALEKVGAAADFVHREEYKTAMDMLTENDFTPANADMLGSILDDVAAQTATDIAAERGITPLQLFGFIDTAPLTARQAFDDHLIDRIGYKDEIEDWAAQKLGDDSKTLEAGDYLSMRRDELKKKDHAVRPVVALIHGVGEMVQEAEHPGGGAFIAADDMVKAIGDAVKDEKVEAILLRIDSPGGSAVASESIRRAVEVAQNSGVPVIVSMGAVAGSGAYWVAAAGDRIFADPATLTGSIGVIAGKVAGTDIWDKLGINWGMITRGENADMWTVIAPFTDAQRAKVDALVGDTYDAFKNVVAEGRGLDPAYVAQIAKGRVWTGAQAFDLGLVDELGGFDDALDYVKSLLGVAEDDVVTLKSFPAPESTTLRLFKWLDRVGSFGAQLPGITQGVAMLRQVMSPVVDALQAQPRAVKMPAFRP